jgi:hypothetical protein
MDDFLQPMATVNVFNITQASFAARTREVRVKECLNGCPYMRNAGSRSSPAVYSTARKSLPTTTVIAEQQHRVQDVDVSVREYFPYRVYRIN